MMMDKCSWNDKSPRYIDADRLIKDLQSSAVKNADNKQYAKGATDGVQLFAVDVVNRAPTVEVQEVKHGHWIRGVSKGFPENPTCLWYCSCCGEKIRYNDTLRTYQKSKKPINEVNPRCRKCGAKMDGDKDV